MKPIWRVKFGLLVLAALFTAAFAWSAAQGQFRPPRPPVFRPPGMPNPPRINPPGIGPSTTVWKCPHCGYEYRGAVPPSTCPGCKAQMSNGMGNGIPGPGGRVNPNPVPPMTPPVMNPNPPIVNMNPPAMNVNPPVANDNPQAVNPVAVNSPAPNPTDNSTSPSDSSSSSSAGSKNWKTVVLVVGIIVIGVFALLGGTFLVIYSMKGSNPKPRRRRRRRDDDDYDRD